MFRLNRIVVFFIVLFAIGNAVAWAQAIPVSSNPIVDLQGQIAILQGQIIALQSQVERLNKAMSGVPDLHFSGSGVVSDIHEQDSAFTVNVGLGQPFGTNSFLVYGPTPDSDVAERKSIAVNLASNEGFIVGETQVGSISVTVKNGVLTAGTLSVPGISFNLTGVQLLSPAPGVGNAALPAIPAKSPTENRNPLLVPVSTLNAVLPELYAQATSPDTLNFAIAGRAGDEFIHGIIKYVQSLQIALFHGVVVCAGTNKCTKYKVRVADGSFGLRG